MTAGSETQAQGSLTQEPPGKGAREELWMEEPCSVVITQCYLQVRLEMGKDPEQRGKRGKGGTCRSK